MPLDKSGTKEAFSSNVSELMHSGRPQKQALAISYRLQREKASGGRAKFADGGSPDQFYTRNQPYIRKDAAAFNMDLGEREPIFRQWVNENKVPFDPNQREPQDYDMRGFWQALQRGDPMARSAIDPNDARMHYPDYWKTPYHETFSNESQWATPNAPRWNDKDQLVGPDGAVIFDDRAVNRESGGAIPLHKPAASIALRLRREKRQAGGASGAPPWYVRSEARGMGHIGGLPSAVPGRTDKLPITVGGGAYVLPADHVSSLGQGNTQAGMAVLNNMFGPSGPYGSGRTMGIKRGAGAPRPPKAPKFQDGGNVDPGALQAAGEGVPILAAGGEFVIPPETVAAIGGGDMNRGHEILDSWVLSNRKEHVRTLRKLPGPAKK